MRNTQGFDSVASYYDFLAGMVFGRSIRKAQTCFLDQIPAEGKILVLGGGTGWWLEQILKDRPGISLLYIDSSVAMIAKAKSYCHGDTRVTFRHATEKSLTRYDEFDVVITFFYLDLFNEERLGAVINQIKANLKSSGQWLVTDFRQESRWHRLMLFVMYRFFSVTTSLENKRLPNWENAMTESGLTMVVYERYYGQFIQSGLYRNG